MGFGGPKGRVAGNSIVCRMAMGLKGRGLYKRLYANLYRDNPALGHAHSKFQILHIYPTIVMLSMMKQQVLKRFCVGSTAH